MKKLVFKVFCRNFILSSLILVTILIFGCKESITGSSIFEESGKPVEIYFCPGDNCGKILENYIKSSNISIHCAFYDLDLKNVIDALSKKSSSADVRLVMDGANSEGQIKGSGIKFDDSKQLMHNKFCVIDKSIVIAGSFNPTDNDNNYNNNNIIIIYSKILAENYEDEFKELWNGKFGEGSKVKYPKLNLNGVSIENYFCPEDECAQKIIDLINNAEKSVHFMAFSFTNENIADAMIKKNKLDIKGIFDSGQASIKYSQFKRMQDFGIDVIKDKNRRKMHHKVFIIDNETIVTGSFNPTLSADTRNDENILIIRDKKIAEIYLDEFENLWG